MTKDKHIAVEVRVDGETVLTIETMGLSGNPDIGRFVKEIQWAAHMLATFRLHGPAKVANTILKLDDIGKP